MNPAVHGIDHARTALMCRTFVCDCAGAHQSTNINNWVAQRCVDGVQSIGGQRRTAYRWPAARMYAGVALPRRFPKGMK